MKPEENVYVKKSNLGSDAKVYESVSMSYNPEENLRSGYLQSNPNATFNGYRRLTLCDPISQICERIEGFFRGCPGIMVSWNSYNNHGLGWKKDEHGEYIVGKQHDKETGAEIDVFYSEDHICELRIYTQDLLQAASLSNVIRHRHVVNEEFGMGSPIDGSDAIGKRAHILYVRVMILNDVDPMDTDMGAGSNPHTTEDDDFNKVIQECYGTYPMKWNDMENYGEVDRLAPSAPDDEECPQTPHGYPEEYEQYLWETGFNGEDVVGGQSVSVSAEQASKWKWKWLKQALEGNPNIADMSFEFEDGMNTWHFIECSRLPIVFQEDNLCSARGFNSILPADLFPLVFSVFGRFNIATYARKSMMK
jgi:hypothetical protein